jgi:cell division protein FtsB
MAEAVKAKRDKPKRTGQLSGTQVMFAAILAIGLLLAINFSSRIAAGQPLQDAYNKVNIEVDQLRKEQADLVRQHDYVQSDAYVSQWARSEGKMVRDGEILVIPVPASGASAQATPEAAPDVLVQTTPPEPQGWQLWWSLFFDTPAPHIFQ